MKRESLMNVVSSHGQLVSEIDIVRYARYLRRNVRNLAWIAGMLAILFLILHPVSALATQQGGGMPFDDTLKKIRDSATGPLAAGLAIVGVIVAGGTLIFGGEIGGFFKSLMFIVLVASMLVGADNILNNLQVQGASGLGAEVTEAPGLSSS
jgi:type IV secretion system protein VirB2